MTFENGFADIERATIAAAKSVASLVAALKQLQKAAAAGEIANLHKAAARVVTMMQSVRQEIDNATNAWPFSEAAEETYMRDSFVAELLETARREGVQIQRLDDGFLIYPSVLRIIPSERSVKIDRKRIQSIRPSRLAKALKSIQTSKPKVAPEQFLELLHRAYRLLVGKEYGSTVALSAIYEAFTLLPGSTATYGPMEFGRDLFILDRSGIARTKSGATISLPASTGTKTGKGTFSFVSPEGETVTYYGIQFKGVAP